MKAMLIFLLVFLPFISFSQTCTTMWPYLYPDFQQGEVTFKDGRKSKESLNIHILESKLHFLKGSLILETSDTLIQSVTVNLDTYLNAGGVFVKVLRSNDAATLGLLRLGDFEALLNSGGAYGASSNTQSVKKLSSLEVGGVNNMNHMYLKESKDNGKTVELVSSYCFVMDGKFYKASKKELESYFVDQAQKEAFISFVKNQNIRWKSDEGLLKVLDYLAEVKK